MIVVDTNVIAHFIIEGEETDLARAVFEADSDWRLPPLWRHEYLNVLVSAGRFMQTPPASLQAAWNEARTRFVAAEIDVDPIAVLDVAVRRGITAYDAQYVALAEQLDVPLVTQDGPLRTACPERAISMRAFCDARGRPAP